MVRITSRTVLLLALSLLTAGCELLAGIFQAGLVVGLIIIVLLIVVIGWLIAKFRRRY